MISEVKIKVPWAFVQFHRCLCSYSVYLDYYNMLGLVYVNGLMATDHGAGLPCACASRGIGAACQIQVQLILIHSRQQMVRESIITLQETARCCSACESFGLQLPLLLQVHYLYNTSSHGCSLMISESHEAHSDPPSTLVIFRVLLADGIVRSIRSFGDRIQYVYEMRDATSSPIAVDQK